MATIYASDYTDNDGKTIFQTNCDMGELLNNVWVDVENDDIIIIPEYDGVSSYRQWTPIIWSGKRFSCLADNVSIFPQSPAGQILWTISETSNSYMRGIEFYNAASVMTLNSVGLQIHNSSNCVIERMRLKHFHYQIIQSTDEAGGVSHFNILKDCVLTSVPDVSDWSKRGWNIMTTGSNSGHMRICGGDYSGASITFDFRQGCGGNHVIGASCQTGLFGWYVVRTGLGGNNFIQPFYLEGDPVPGTTYPDSNHSPYDSTDWKDQYKSWGDSDFCIEFANSDNNIYINPNGRAGHDGAKIIDTGSNNIVINNMNGSCNRVNMIKA